MVFKITVLQSRVESFCALCIHGGSRVGGGLVGDCAWQCQGKAQRPRVLVRYLYPEQYKNQPASGSLKYMRVVKDDKGDRLK